MLLHSAKNKLERQFYDYDDVIKYLRTIFITGSKDIQWNALPRDGANTKKNFKEKKAEIPMKQSTPNIFLTINTKEKKASFETKAKPTVHQVRAVEGKWPGFTVTT